MPRKSKINITTSQQAYLKANHKRMTAPEIAKALKLPNWQVYDNLIALNLDFKRKYKPKVIREVEKEGIFNVGEFTNWVF